MQLDKGLMIQMYRDMVLGRVFEERVEELSHRGLVPGSVHMGIGEEAAQVGAVRAVTHEDYVIPSHRGHVSALTKGGEPKLLMAELLGKATGYSGGRSGSCHLVDASSNNLGVQGIIDHNSFHPGSDIALGHTGAQGAGNRSVCRTNAGL